MDDRVVVVDVLVCLSFVLRGRYDYGCGLWLKDMVEGHGCGWMIVVVAKGLRLDVLVCLSFVLRGRHDYGCVDDMIMVVMVCLSFVLRGRHDLVVVGASHLNGVYVVKVLLWLSGCDDDMVKQRCKSGEERQEIKETRVWGGLIWTGTLKNFWGDKQKIIFLDRGEDAGA
ncbi:hypothetical protein F2Q69_00063051 [Brassica cretica]|uniref:Uncharacterized protein n=1 Tax=Brassica cretica TaxID=69181 RepID=A0A8S9RRC0_BRACR|nr:hypothetical protein F2Q69_00063051 [Brassica cretica]